GPSGGRVVRLLVLVLVEIVVGEVGNLVELLGDVRGIGLTGRRDDLRLGLVLLGDGGAVCVVLLPHDLGIELDGSGFRLCGWFAHGSSFPHGTCPACRPPVAGATDGDPAPVRGSSTQHTCGQPPSAGWGSLRPRRSATGTWWTRPPEGSNRCSPGLPEVSRPRWGAPSGGGTARTTCRGGALVSPWARSPPVYSGTGVPASVAVCTAASREAAAGAVSSIGRWWYRTPGNRASRAAVHGGVPSAAGQGSRHRARALVRRCTWRCAAASRSTAVRSPGATARPVPSSRGISGGIRCG